VHNNQYWFLGRPLSLANDSPSPDSSAMSWDPSEAPKLDFNENLYSILDVLPSVNAEQLKKAYHKVVARHHPDNRETAEDKLLGNRQMMVINFAYKILKDAKTRSEYDAKIGVTGSLAAASGDSAKISKQDVVSESLLRRETPSPVSSRFKKFVESDIGAWQAAASQSSGDRDKTVTAPKSTSSSFSSPYGDRNDETRRDDFDEAISDLLYSSGDGSIKSLQVS